MKNDPRIVSVGIDTLKVHIRFIDDEGVLQKTGEISQSLKQRCEIWQAQAKEQKDPIETPLLFNDRNLLMYPNGAPAWNYILRNDSIEVKLDPRLKMAMPASVTFQSMYLWALDTPYQAVEALLAFLPQLLDSQQVFLQVAQIDLCVDVMNFVPPDDIQQAFLTRSRKKQKIEPSEKHKEIYNGRKLETVLFSGHGRPFSGKLYNKRAEIEQQSKKRWFYPRWKENGWDEEAEVWRMEFSVEREGFHDFKIEGVYQALEQVERLWRYCSRDWLRMVVPGRGKQRTRWTTDPTWKLIQKAFHQQSRSGLGPLVRERTREVNIEMLVAQIAGCATTLAAWHDHINERSDTLEEEILSLVRIALRERWKKNQETTQDVVREKKLLYSQPLHQKRTQQEQDASVPFSWSDACDFCVCGLEHTSHDHEREMKLPKWRINDEPA